MGSKVDAKALVAAAGVPVLPSWAPGEVPADARYPLLVKASYGGGGRGMRVVRAPGELADAVAAAEREAAASFGNGLVFVERWLERSRHVEVQVLADRHGKRRRGRRAGLLRAAPAPEDRRRGAGRDPDPLRQRLFDAAVAAARSVGYVGAGTVEFLVSADEDAGGEPAFLEMNTRLQVEHPVTEAVTGIDLVALQLSIAEGGPLPFDAPPPVRGHAIEARLYAEDPAAGWRPSTGTLHRIAVPGGVRVDAGVVDGDAVSAHYDPLLAKVVAHGPSRAAAARKLAAALAGASLHGLVTNRDLLVRVLRSDGFAAGPHTGFLDEQPELLAPLAGTAEVATAALVAALAGSARRRASAPVQRSVPAGWRNNPSQPATATYAGPDGDVTVSYRPAPVTVVSATRTPSCSSRTACGSRTGCTRSDRCPMWTVRVGGRAARGGPAAGAGGRAAGRLADRADAGPGRRGAGGQGRPGQRRAAVARAGGDEDGAPGAGADRRRAGRVAGDGRVPSGRR
jgi:propionyl-CoA carboxylase alpha chain